MELKYLDNGLIEWNHNGVKRLYNPRDKKEDEILKDLYMYYEKGRDLDRKEALFDAAGPRISEGCFT